MYLYKLRLSLLFFSVGALGTPEGTRPDSKQLSTPVKDANQDDKAGDNEISEPKADADSKLKFDTQTEDEDRSTPSVKSGNSDSKEKVGSTKRDEKGTTKRESKNDVVDDDDDEQQLDAEDALEEESS